MNRFTYNECTEQLHEDDNGELCLYEDAYELQAENERLREYISDQITRLEVLKVTAYRLETALRESNDLLQEFDNIEEINIQILDNNMLMKDIKSGRYENAIRKIESIITGD